MTMTKENPEFRKHLETAKKNGIRYGTYWSRCFLLGWRPERAATKPPEVGRTPSPDSIRSKCKLNGVSHRSYYNVKEFLDDMEASYTPDDIIEILIARKGDRADGSK